MVFSLSSGFAYAGDVQAFVNASVSKRSFTKLELRRIFSRKQTLWPNGQAIKVFVLPSKNNLHQRFSKEVLKIFPYQLDRIWNKLTYSGIGIAPTVVDSPEELLKAVIATPGAVGYGEGVTDEGGVYVISIKE